MLGGWVNRVIITPNLQVIQLRTSDSWPGLMQLILEFRDSVSSVGGFRGSRVQGLGLQSVNLVEGPPFKP